MSRQFYESLSQSDNTLSDTDSLVGLFAQAGRSLRDAKDLATDEMLEGLWADVNDAPETVVRLAADDRTDPTSSVIFRGGVYAVRLDRTDDAEITATQILGPGGASIEQDGGWIPLTPDVAVVIPGDGIPSQVMLIDAQGMRMLLEP